MGVALQVPQIVSMFIKGIPPDLRIPEDYRALAITSQTGLIDDISTEEVMAKIQLAFSGVGVAKTNMLHMRHQ